VQFLRRQRTKTLLSRIYLIAILLFRTFLIEAALTLNVTPPPGTVPNFAVEITASVACTVTVTSTVGGTTTTLKYAAAAGNELEESKTYQLTCVGSCWTLAEFAQPTP
jgi:hypothetical protein